MRNSVLFAAILAIAAAATPMAGRTDDAPYPTMAPLAQYTIPERAAEIALARSAAPPELSIHATILVLMPHGYVTAAQGTNGFTCLVERSWSGPFNNPDFWNPNVRGPICYNAAASRTVLKYSLFRTNQALSGTPKSEIRARAAAAVASGTLAPPAPGAMAYMMSKGQYLGDALKAAHPHLMFFASKADKADGGASWGANAKGSPVLIDPSDVVSPEPVTVFFIPVSHWSDGSSI